MSEAHPDFGFVSALVDVQRYVEGRSHVVCATTTAADISRLVISVIVNVYA